MKMKTILFTLLLIPFLGIGQTLENLDFVSPFHDNHAAVKKGNKWAFIDQNSKITVDFRNDLVSTKTEEGNYPMFREGKCLVIHQKEGVHYYGFIDTSGTMVIEPQFLNASNFEDGKALALVVHKETIGYNDIFKKDVVNYHYFEVVINTEGKTLDHLTQLAIHISPKNKGDKNPPAITSKFISENLVAAKKDSKKWNIKTINK